MWHHLKHNIYIYIYIHLLDTFKLPKYFCSSSSSAQVLQFKFFSSSSAAQVLQLKSCVPYIIDGTSLLSPRRIACYEEARAKLRQASRDTESRDRARRSWNNASNSKRELKKSAYKSKWLNPELAWNLSRLTECIKQHLGTYVCNMQPHVSNMFGNVLN